MPKLIDLSGQRFGRLRVISRHSENTKLNRAYWNCICDCGGAGIGVVNMAFALSLDYTNQFISTGMIFSGITIAVGAVMLALGKDLW